MAQIINPLTAITVTEDDLKAYVTQKDIELQSDFSQRLNGIANKVGTGKKIAGYEILRDFFDGDQWSFSRADGIQPRVYNYCRTTVLNYTSFLANESPEDDVPPRDNNDDLEVSRAEEVEKILLAVKEDNEFPVVFTEAVQNQSLLGDCFIFGPYVEWKFVGTRKTGKKDKEGSEITEKVKIPRIRFKNIKKPENVRIIWADEDYNEMIGFILYYRVATEKAEKIYQEQMKKRDIKTLASDVSSTQETGASFSTVKVFWNARFLMAMVDNKVLDFVEHNWGFIPGIFVKNISHSTRPWGISDIEDILDPQVEYNEAAAATRGKINQVAIPHIFYSGESAPIEYEAGQAQMIKIGPEDRIFPDPMGQSTAPFENYQTTRKQDIHHISMISEIFHGSAMTAKATGRALSVLMQGVNNKVKGKQQYWKVALKKLNGHILRLIELYVPDSKQIIQGYYKTDIFFPSILIRNITEEINKFNMKLQSQYTTMKNLGIPSPKEELKIMKREWDDTSLMIEISRNPAFRMQVQQMMAEMMAARVGGGPAQGPMLTEAEGGAGRTAEEELPASAPKVPQQAPISQGGAISQRASRGI